MFRGLAGHLRLAPAAAAIHPGLHVKLDELPSTRARLGTRRHNQTRKCHHRIAEDLMAKMARKAKTSRTRKTAKRRSTRKRKGATRRTTARRVSGAAKKPARGRA